MHAAVDQADVWTTVKSHYTVSSIW